MICCNNYGACKNGIRDTRTYIYVYTLFTHTHTNIHIHTHTHTIHIHTYSHHTHTHAHSPSHTHTGSAIILGSIGETDEVKGGLYCSIFAIVLGKHWVSVIHICDLLLITTITIGSVYNNEARSSPCWSCLRRPTLATAEILSADYSIRPTIINSYIFIFYEMYTNIYIYIFFIYL